MHAAITNVSYWPVEDGKVTVGVCAHACVSWLYMLGVRLCVEHVLGCECIDCACTQVRKHE